MADTQVLLNRISKEQILYHYTKSNGINGIINHNCFWATKSDFLNDPDEFSHIRAIILSVTKELIPNKVWRKLFLADVLDETTLITGGRNRDYFVLSFSLCRDSITLWSEFGSKTGYNVGFAGQEMIRRIAEGNLIEYHGLVVYAPEVQKSIIRALLKEYIPQQLGVSLEQALEAGFYDRKSLIYRKACRKFQKITAVYAMFFKKEAFAQEQEYRFVFRRQETTQVYFREKDGFMIPYIEVPLSDARLPVHEIMVAPQNHIDLAKKGMEYMMKYKGYQVKVSLSGIKLRY